MAKTTAKAKAEVDEDLQADGASCGSEELRTAGHRRNTADAVRMGNGSYCHLPRTISRGIARGICRWQRKLSAGKRHELCRKLRATCRVDAR